MAAAFAVFMYGSPDRPTSMTNAAALAKRTLPVDLPALVKPTGPDDDAGAYYEQAIGLVGEHPDVLTRTREHDDLVDDLCELLLKAADAGRVEDGFMDGHIPVSNGARPDYGEAVELIYEWVLQRSAVVYAKGEKEQSRELALTVWVFGQRLFEHNVRLYHRNIGLDMMESAGALLFEMAAEDQALDAEVLQGWAVALNDIRRAWQPKLEVMLGVEPHPGDLVNIALNDQDRMFRVEATLKLGIQRYTVDRSNRRAMNGAIRDAIDSDDALLSESGRAADAVTLEQMRRAY